MLAFQKAGVPTVDYGNNIRQVALEEGVKNAFDFPGLRAGIHPAAVLPRRRPVPLGRAVRRPGRHREDRRARSRSCCPTTSICTTGSTWRKRASSSRDCPRASAGWASATGTGSASRSTRWWRSGELKAPVVIGRDHLDSGSVASPNRETEAMRDGCDAVSDWPLLNALLNTASGATWVSLHHGGGVGMGFSQHAGVVIVCDGSEAAAQAHRARVVERSGHRRDAACGRGLRHRDRSREETPTRFAGNSLKQRGNGEGGVEFADAGIEHSRLGLSRVDELTQRRDQSVTC